MFFNNYTSFAIIITSYELKVNCILPSKQFKATKAQGIKAATAYILGAELRIFC